MKRVLPGLYVINLSSIVILRGSAAIRRGPSRHLPGLCRHSPGPYRLYHTLDHPRFVSSRTPVVPGRAEDEVGKAIPSQITQDDPGDNKYFTPSGVECRMFPDVADSVTGVHQLFQVVPGSPRTSTGALPGCSRDRGVKDMTDDCVCTPKAVTYIIVT
jgi:hypothetical protein